MVHRRDLTYQFPVYRWLSWLVIAGFAVGLGLMYLVAGMFGIPAPLGWGFLVIVFCAGIALLERPKVLLTVMMFYFLLMPSNRLLGLIGLPLPGFLDELFFIPFIAVIVMSWIQRAETPAGMWFPLAFMAVGGMSWYVNGRPSPFTAVQVTLIMLKFWIVWYFCRLTCTFKDRKAFWRWGEAYISYAAVQFLYNCLWQRRPWVTTNVDFSGGVFGPDAFASHAIGYISILALYLLAAWWIGERPRAKKWKRAWMLLMGLVILYDLLVMTDTKHGIFLMPLAFLPILFHPNISARVRAGLLAVGGAVTVLGFAFLVVAVHTGVAEWSKFARFFVNSPKGEAYEAVTRDFRYLVPYPLFGAAPGCFFSDQAGNVGAPLARRYLVPYINEAARSSLTHSISVSTGGGSALLFPKSDLLTLMGEYGWLGTGIYAGFIVWIWYGLWRRSRIYREGSMIYLGLGMGILFLSMTMFFANTSTVACLTFPWWMLVGRAWDMFEGKDGKTEPSAEGGENPVIEVENGLAVDRG